ncbi:hypothetical protein GOP47_0008955 [Adiantum capillus-veneris]|uniref:B30.2/SPRY domain-containing protein n=2 Tax=Adiantum capillus-veneris TaxID=13818 RepID=A0A9D4UZA9_ADICA|nr:hypothetical protein GOP47_0008955 [Adiantum capillus-veneris]
MASRSMQEDYSLSLLQTIEATSRSSIEEPLGATASGSMQEEHAPSLVHAREATARSPTEETLGDMTSASMHRSTTNEEKRTKQDVGDLVDMKVEAGSNIRSCSEKAAEEQVEEDGQHTSALSATEESLGDMTSGSMHRLMPNEEERTKQDVGDLGDMKVEARSDIWSCRKRAAEEQVEEDGRHVSALSDNIVDAERKKGRMAVGVSAPLNEEDRVSDLGTESDTMICTQSNRETNFVQGLESDLGKEMTGHEKEEGSGSMMVQTELRATTDISLKQELGSVTAQTELIAGITDVTFQSLTGRERVHERTECDGEAAVLTVAVGDTDVAKEQGKSHAGMDTEMVSDQRMEIVAGEGAQVGRQELLGEKDLGASEKNLGIGSTHSYQDIESCAGQGPKQEVTEGKEFPQGNKEAAEKDGMDVSACHVEVGSSKESGTVVKAEQRAQMEEGTPYFFGQETLVSSAVPGSLQLSASDGSGTSHADVLQRESKPYQKVETQMKARLAEAHQEEMEGSSGNVSRELSLKRSKEEEPVASVGKHWHVGIVMKVKSKSNSPVEDTLEGHKENFASHAFEERQVWAFQGAGHDNGMHPSGRRVFEEEKTGLSDEANTGTSEEEKFFGGQERGRIMENTGLKRKLSDNLVCDSGAMNEPGQSDSVVKKAKKKAVNVWAKTTTRKGPKKNSKNGGPQNPPTEDSVLLTPVYVNPDKVEDGPDQPIALSKYDKAEKIELSENRLSASSTKGYRMVRATRGVQEGTWYYEIVVEQLGPTGHTRLGWSTQKGDVQAPVGFDSNSYGYRDLDGSKTHVAVRETYGDLYVEGDVIGFYIHLPNGAEYAPKPAPLLSVRGRPYLSDVKEEQPRRVPGSEICFFRNGICQGTAFKDIYGGRYFPAASMYTLPKEPSCTVRFNFGPDFRYPPKDLDGRPAPKAMMHAPYHNALSGNEIGPVAYANVSPTGLDTQNMEPQMKMV